MRVFVWEFICSGAMADFPVSSPLFAEGRAMLVSLLADLAATPDQRITTCWDARLTRPQLAGVEWHLTHSVDAERQQFAELARAADLVFIIAPESGDVLSQRLRWCEQLPTATANCTSQAAALCADKLRLAQTLAAAGLPTPQTALNSSVSPTEFPVALKPRWGAGCEQTWKIESENQFQRWLTNRARVGTDRDQFVRQTWVDGTHGSLAAIFNPQSTTVQPLAHCLQSIEIGTAGQLHYRGGSVVRAPDGQAEQMLTRLQSALPGLNGYVGIDYVATGESGEVSIIEINPRLTTSYLGYRQLYGAELANAICRLRAVELPDFSGLPFAFQPSTSSDLCVDGVPAAETALDQHSIQEHELP